MGSSWFKNFFTPASILLLSILGCMSLLLLITLLLYKTRYKETISKIWLLLFSLSIGYISIDLIAGYFLISRLSPPMVPDQFSHHKLVPNTRTQFKTREYYYVQTINKLGLRGHDVQQKKPAGHYRILMLGDSFTLGDGVDDDKTFSALLEESFKKSPPLPKTIEVINAGVDSYTPILSFFQLAKHLGALEPDLIVLNFDMSDLIQEVSYRRAAIYTADGKIIGINGHDTLRVRVRTWIIEHLYMTRLALFFFFKKFLPPMELTIEDAVTVADPRLLRHTLSGDTVDRNGQWQNIFDSLLKLKKYCDSNGIHFLLSAYPWGHQVSDKEWIPGRSLFIPENAVVSDKSIDTIQEFALNNNVEFLNLFPAFRAYNGTPPLYYSYDMHWTPAGHRLMAQELERKIRSTYFKR